MLHCIVKVAVLLFRVGLEREVAEGITWKDVGSTTVRVMSGMG